MGIFFWHLKQIFKELQTKMQYKQQGRIRKELQDWKKTAAKSNIKV